MLLDSSMSVVGDIELHTLGEMEQDKIDEIEMLLEWAAKHSFFTRPKTALYQWVYWDPKKGSAGTTSDRTLDGDWGSYYWGTSPRGTLEDPEELILKVMFQGSYIETVREALKIHNSFLSRQSPETQAFEKKIMEEE